MDKHRLLEELKENPKNIRFGRLCTIAEAFGFTLRGVKGSHRIYVRSGVRELLNFQNVKDSKPLSSKTTHTYYRKIWPSRGGRTCINIK